MRQGGDQGKKVPPSTPDDLARGGVTIRIYRDSRTKLKELARLRGSKMAECFDALVTHALQEAYDEGLGGREENPSQG